MSVYNKIGGGANKVLIDNKPPADRLNLTEVETIVRNRAIIPGNFSILARKNNEFYISSNLTILKGNPYKDWTQVFSFNNISMQGYNRGIKLEDDGSLTYVNVDDSNSTTRIYIYGINIKDGTVTLKKEFNIEGCSYKRLFILGNTLYVLVIGSYNRIDYLYINELGEDNLTDITKNIQFENDTNISYLTGWYDNSTFANKRYKLNIDGRKVNVVEFDGKVLKIIKEINCDFKINTIYAEQSDLANADEIYFTILSEPISSNPITLRKYKLINKDFNIVQDGETAYSVSPNYHFIMNNNYIVREVLNNNSNTMVEFPIKAYVRRE